MIRRVGSRYELQEPIGDGGMAVVYRAIDTILGRTVAVKMLRPQFAGDDEFINRFRQEAQAAARLSHPNIVNLYDVGMTDDEYYIVMEFVDGPTLKDLIRDKAPLSIQESVDIAMQICDALEHAHDHQIIHRDIKPHNILLTRNGRVKVTDFGIARAITGNTITHQHATSVLGSVHYFSPEQAKGGATDEKSDIYSLGVVLYEMLTGQLPFSGDSPVSVALKHLRDHFTEPRSINPEIPQSVENIILRCLVKSPADRYPDMRAVKADLKIALSNPDVPKFVMPEEVTDETIVIPAIGGASGMLESKESLPPKKKRWWMGLVWTGVALGVLCIGVFAAYYIVMYILQGKNVTLPSVVNLPEKQALTKLQTAGFSPSLVQVQKAYNAKPSGVVYSQDPPGGSTVKEGRDITLYISRGSAKVAIPSLQDVPYDQAVQTLLTLGFNNPIEVQEYSEQVDKGNVISTDPGAGTPVPLSTKITVYVSKGPQILVPYVAGYSLDQATQILKEANLALGKVTYTSNAQPYGTVLDEGSYQPGQPVAKGTSIPLTVSSGPAPNPGNATGNATGNAIGNTTDNSTGAGNNVLNGSSNGADSSGTNQGTFNNNALNNATGFAGGTNGSGGGNTSGATSLPADTHMKPAEVTVSDTGNKTLNVVIYKTDAEGSLQQWASTQITSTSSWVVPLYLTPQTPQGELIVYVNNKKVVDRVVKY